jgi:hypothetical protein
VNGVRRASLRRTWEAENVAHNLRDGSYVPKRVKDEIDFNGPIERGAKKMPAQRVQEFLTLSGFLSRLMAISAPQLRGASGLSGGTPPAGDRFRRYQDS